MNFITPLPFSEALEALESRQLLPTDLGSSDIRRIDEDIRARSLFSARTTKATILQDFKDGLGRLLDSRANMADVRASLQDSYDALGYTPEKGFPEDEGVGIPPAERGSLRDLSSDSRVNLVLETNMRLEANRAMQRAGESDFALYAWPCYELVRIYPRTVPRGKRRAKGGTLINDPSNGWPARWERAGGQLYAGRMIARKDSDVWQRLGNSSMFSDALDTGVPPFVYGTGYGWREVPREEAIALGVIDQDAEVADRASDREAAIEAAADFDPEFLRALRDGLDVEISEGRARLASNVSPDSLDLAWNSRTYRRDHLGRFAADGGSLSVRDNIARGTRAIRRALRIKADVPNAMQVRGIGRIDFEWGRPGTKKRNPFGVTHTDGYGISHIVAKHGKKAAIELPRVLSRGTISPSPKSPLKREIRYGNRLAVIERKDLKSAYVVTSFDEVSGE